MNFTKNPVLDGDMRQRMTLALESLLPVLAHLPPSKLMYERAAFNALQANTENSEDSSASDVKKGSLTLLFLAAQVDPALGENIFRMYAGSLDPLDQIRGAMDQGSEDLSKGKERLGNFEMQRLMSAFNQAETLASSVQKKSQDSANTIIHNIFG